MHRNHTPTPNRRDTAGLRFTAFTVFTLIVLLGLAEDPARAARYPRLLNAPALRAAIARREWELAEDPPAAVVAELASHPLTALLCLLDAAVGESDPARADLVRSAIIARRSRAEALR